MTAFHSDGRVIKDPADKVRKQKIQTRLIGYGLDLGASHDTTALPVDTGGILPGNSRAHES